MGRKTLFVDINRCTGCDLCALTCSFVKEKTYSYGKSRVWVVKDESRALGIPVVCEQCEDAPCVAACPTKALVKEIETGIVKLNGDRCIGCKECMWICPFGAILIDPKKGVAIKCDLCDGDPACVKVCYPRALQYLRLDRPSELMKRQKLVEKRLRALASVALGGVV